MGDEYSLKIGKFGDVLFACGHSTIKSFDNRLIFFDNPSVFIKHFNVFAKQIYTNRYIYKYIYDLICI
jgi:hypothetical protein